MGTKKQRFLILDANILIDFFKCDKTIIKLICTYVGQIHVATPVLNEVDEITESDCLELGIMLVEPEIDQVMLAVTEKRGPLSFQDNLCLVLAKHHGWTCVTNDKPLRRECEREGVSLIWGIDLICILVESQGISAIDAKDIILEIHHSNPKYITEEVVKRAFARLGD